MQEHSEIAKALSNMQGNNIYVYFTPEVMDFTNKNIVPELNIFDSGKSLKVSLKDDFLLFILPLLKFAIFTKGRKIISWDWKNFESYVLAKTNKPFALEGITLIDLKVIESYVGRKLKTPKSLVEALNRLKDIVTTGLWKEIEPIYKKIHIPLITTVIPRLETVFVLDKSQNKRVYSHYEIDGQKNGRLKCSNFYLDGYVPHTMSADYKNFIKPRSEDEFFMSFDFHANEVFVLAWVSKDPRLMELCKEKDVYVALHRQIIGGEENRDVAKKIFLPFFYGAGITMLSQRLGLSTDKTKLIVNRINELFPVAISFVDSYPKQIKDFGYAKDLFGKYRFDFTDNFSSKNFSIQSPASIFCLEKLIKLSNVLRGKTDVVYSAHDGYVVYGTKDKWRAIAKISYEVLSSESEMCPGLKIPVVCRGGRNLNNLKLIKLS